MSITFNELTEFNHPVFRNIQGISPTFDEFDDLTADPKAKAYAHRITTADTHIGSNEHRFHAIDFVFNQTTWHSTRFGNGKYPVWYGSVELQTGFHETLYHWYRTFIQAPAGFSSTTNNTIKTRRTVFTVECNAALIDLREKCNQTNALVHPDPSHYPYTQQIGRRIHQEGYPGLLTKSARTADGENVVVFKKNILSAAAHHGDYLYEYDTINHNAMIKNQLSNELELVDTSFYL